MAFFWKLVIKAVPIPASLFATSPLSLRDLPAVAGASLVRVESMAVSMPPGLEGGTSSIHDMIALTV